MQLRTRKKVDYSANADSTPSNTKSKKAAVLKTRKPKSAMNLKTTSSPATGQRNNINKLNNIPKKNRKNITKKDEELNKKMKNVTLTRPFYKSQTDYTDEGHAITTIQELKNFSSTLEKLIPLQQKLYYEDLDGPQFLGPRNFETLKLPSDIQKLKDISSGVNDFVQYKESVEKVENMLKENPDAAADFVYKPTITEERLKEIRMLSQFKDIPEYDMVDRLANIHNININDIKCIRNLNIKQNLDSNFINKNEVNVISKKLEKKLQKERNNGVSWPNKIKLKKIQKQQKQTGNPDLTRKIRFIGVPLFNPN